MAQGMDVNDEAVGVHFWDSGGNQITVKDTNQARRDDEHPFGAIATRNPFLQIDRQVRANRYR